ncbi:MAG: hypothetical protein JWM68_3330 [Verrucomicrobiales bacterium]|nr:hypothetical protein [Verrucomicrobiales bacterium]
MKRTNTPRSPFTGFVSWKHARLKQAVSILSLITLCTSAFTATPPAGSSIGNIASATYTDGSGTVRSVNSNVAVTLVNQVAGLTLTQDNTKPVSPGGQVDFPHTLKNTGNGADTYTLSIGGVTGFATSVIYADANGDGIPDDLSTPISSTGSLIAGGTFKFVIVATVPNSPATATDTLTITATSGFATNNAANLDTAKVTPNAVINVTKAINVSSGAAGSGPYTYTLTYNNSGNTTATNLTLTDIIPAEMTYVANSGVWSVGGALTDLAAGDPAGIDYNFGVVPGRVTAVIATVAPGASGTITFQVNVNSGLPPQEIINQAKYSYNDGQNAVGPFDSNVAKFLIPQFALVDITGQTLTNAVPQGATVSFTNVVTNLGNGTDTFNLSFGTNNFPAGTTFQFYQVGGAAVLLDSNTDNIPDSGPLSPAGTYTVIVKATLPGTASGTNLTVQVIATSSFNTSVSDSALDILGAVTPNTVDLTNDSAGPGSPGSGPGPEASAVTTVTASPTNIVTVRFTNYVANSSALADTYNLAASTVANFSSISLPSGWIVTFRDSGNAVITSTGVINPGANKLVYADVTIPAQNAPGTNHIYFQVLSPVTGASDIKHDAVAVTTFRAMSVAPNNSAQIFPGGSVVYSHTIQNNGNVSEAGANSAITLTDLNSLSGWTSVIYYDSNANGVLDTNEVIVTSITNSIAPGASVKVLVKVFAPPGAPIGANNGSTLAVTTTIGTYIAAAPAVVSASDSTTVISADLTLLKKQALDLNCDGTNELAFTTSQINTGLPGNCIRYEITAKNNGSTLATNIIVSDATPSFTTYNSAVPLSVVAPSPTVVTTNSVPVNGAAGTISVKLDQLAPGASAVIEFGVKINP